MKNKAIDELPNTFSRKLVEDKLKLKSRSAQRQIKSWVAAKLIRLTHKEGREFFYVKSSVGFTSYQKNFIDNYIPNKTFFLSAKERSYLTKLLSLNSQIDLETFSIKLFERLLIDLSWGSSQLEGNTFSLLETEKLILFNESIEGKSSIDVQMILNHKEAIKFLILNRKSCEMNPYTVKSVHALLSENLILNIQSIGALRKIPVGINGTSYTPISVPQLLKEEFTIFLKKAREIQNPIEQSFFILIFLPYLQAFEDVNKRTSRICCNIPLIKNNLLPLSFKNIKRENYVAALIGIYENNNPQKMKDVFISAVEFSSHEYKNMVIQMPTPHLSLIKHRLFIKKIISNCVSNCVKLRFEEMQAIPKNDRDVVFNHLQNELIHLHEGQLIRFDLTFRQFEKWKKLKLI
jgi:hypothetical protein